MTASALHLYAKVEVPDVVAPPVAGRIIYQEGRHDFLELVWRRSVTGHLPGWNQGFALKQPIAVRFGRRSQPVGLEGERWFYGYVESFDLTERSMTVVALGVTERLKQANPRYYPDGMLSDVVESVVRPYGLRARVEDDDLLVQGTFQEDSDWAFLNSLADLYGYALVCDGGVVVLRRRGLLIYGNPPLFTSPEQGRTNFAVQRGYWLMQPVRHASGDMKVTYCIGNVEPRTGVPFVESEDADRPLNRRRYISDYGSNGVRDTRTTLVGTMHKVKFSSDTATAVAHEGVPQLRPGTVIYSQVDKSDLDGLWWVHRVEHRFEEDLSQTSLDLSRPLLPTIETYDLAAMLPAMRSARPSTFSPQPMLVGLDWRFG